MKKLLLFIVSLSLVVGLAACGNKTPEDVLEFTVTFETDGGTEIESVVVENGAKVSRPSDPTKDGFIFDGVWMNGTSEWDFDVDIVTEDITLTAGWIEISATPTNITMTDDVFSSSVSWVQTDADTFTFDLYIKGENETEYSLLDGTISVDAGDVLDTVTFTPNDVPMGGYYDVKVALGSEEVIVEGLLFAGGGTEDNPYLTSKISDMNAILTNDDLSDKHFLQVNDILMTLEETIEINNDKQIQFSGVYDGGNFELSFGGNGGFFHEITQDGIVKNLVIASTTQLSASETNYYPIGLIANTNNGLIDNVRTSGKVVNTDIQGALPVWDGSFDPNDTSTGAGAIVGINGETGVISNVYVSGSGAVKSGRGIGGVSAYNYGTISGAIITATLGAGNQANSGKSTNNYSFGGGITGFNFGTITECVVTGRVFAQNAMSTAADGNEGKNVVIGGIAGYNEGTITQSSFARDMSRKEFIDKTRAEELDDSSNNLGVASIHGDLYVGGIAGINNGDINNVYIGGALIGGRDFIGGITGLSLSNGTITNSYVFAELAVKDEEGQKITTTSDRTTLTLYEIAPDGGFDSSSTLYKPLINSETAEIWVPGDYEQPMLPEFTSVDHDKVGSEFAENGLLNWQNGVVTAVDISLDSIVMGHGETVDIDFSVTPSNAPDTFTTWTSSDESVVMVTSEGQIKGVGAGVATVTVTTRDGGFTDTIEVTVEDYTQITSYTVSCDEFTLPNANDSEDRMDVNIGDTCTINVTDILPEDATYQNYTVSTSNSRAVAEGNVVTFVYGNTGPGRVSIYVTFEDSSIGELNYRFTTNEVVGDIPITSVSVSAEEFELPNANDSEDRMEMAIGNTATINVDDILPINATNQNYTITTSNSRAEVEGNVVTFVYGNTGPGNVSIYVTFEDASIGELNYRFLTYEKIDITSVTITADEITLPNANDSDNRIPIDIGTVVTINVTDILPIDATDTDYTITTSNSRAEVEGNVVTFVYGNTGPGSVSIYVTFEDTTIGDEGEFNYRFTTVDNS